MNYVKKNDDEVDVCYKNACVRAKGKNAEVITFGLFTMFLLIGIAAIAKS